MYDVYSAYRPSTGCYVGLGEVGFDRNLDVFVVDSIVAAISDRPDDARRQLDSTARVATAPRGKGQGVRRGAGHRVTR